MKNLTPTNFKGYLVSSISDGHYPIAEAGLRNSYGNSFVNYMLFNNRASWQKLSGMQALFDYYHTNPVFYAVVMIKAREYGNMRIEVRNRSTDAVEPANTRKPLPKKLYKLFDRPNVMQGRGEFFQQRKIFYEVAGNDFTYGNFTDGFDASPENCEALWNVWPANMEYMLAGNYFEATEIEDVIKKWKFNAGQYKKEWEPHEILHRNKPNTNLNDGLIFGRATAHSLIKPLSNIDIAYESRNVIMKNRGARVLFTSDKGDNSGKIPLLEDEKKEWFAEMKKYGTMEDQHPFWFSHLPLKATTIDQDVMKLGLFEEIATDAMMVCNGFGVPEVLLKLYIKGATFENQQESVKRLYQGTLIPEAIEDINSLNNFLHLDETDYYLYPTFDHVPWLQESENQKVSTLAIKSKLLMTELAQNLITREMYWERMGYGPIPAELKEAPEPKKLPAGNSGDENEETN